MNTIPCFYIVIILFKNHLHLTGPLKEKCALQAYDNSSTGQNLPGFMETEGS
jgi:hypothetical protein